ncbi:MAG: cell division protein ZapA [bacterium]
MAEKRSVQVTIFHQPYTLRVSEDEREVIELADSVDQLMNAVASRSGASDPVRVAVLTALHLADRLRTLQRDLTAVREKTDEFSKLLDDVLAGDGADANS